MNASNSYTFSSDEEIQMCVYKITHKVSGKVYVGKTNNKAKNRWLAHLSSSRRPHSAAGKTKIARSIAKNGVDSFTFEVIDIAESSDSLIKKEIFWINYYSSLSPNGYNLTVGGEGGIVSEESREKMRKSSKRLPSVTRVKVTRNDGVVFDSITQAALLNNTTTKAISTCFHKSWRIIAGHQFKSGIHDSWEIVVRQKSNVKYLSKFILRSDGKKYSRVKDAAEDLGVTRNSILNVLSGHCKTCKGYYFERIS